MFFGEVQIGGLDDYITIHGGSQFCTTDYHDGHQYTYSGVFISASWKWSLVGENNEVWPGIFTELASTMGIDGVKPDAGSQ